MNTKCNSPLRCAVVGVGYLGRFHAQKYHAVTDAELVGVCDTDSSRANEVSKELGCASFNNHAALIGQVDAVSIASTTQTHFSIAKDLLSAGIHVLIEKPITQTVKEADTLIELAKENGCTLQVGHLERFNSVKTAIDDHITTPRFIESQRIAPFKPRGTDVNVILDLMIHDIDMLQAIVKSKIVNIDAQGAPVLSQDIDIASVRLHFANGCVANVGASRISFKTERRMRIFQPESYISVDFQNKKLAVFTKGQGEMFPGIPDVSSKEYTFAQSDALLDEIKAFVWAIQHQQPPLVTGTDGRDALATADKISQAVHQHLNHLETVC